jgi:hypothetical protein
LVADLMLQALTSRALAVSLQLAEDLELERVALHRQWRQRLERAHYEVERARRQYDAVEPENRLVVRTLEQRWEAALSEELRLAAEHERFLAEQPLPLTPDERAAIEELASDIPAVWSAPSTTAGDRAADAGARGGDGAGRERARRRRVSLAGGQCTRHDLRRPVARLTQLSDHAALMARIRALREAGQKAPAIAAALNAEGWRPAKRRLTFTAGKVRTLLRRQGILAFPRQSPASRLERRDVTELTIPETAARLGMPEITLYCWMRRGLASAPKVQVLGHSLWLIRAEPAPAPAGHRCRKQGAQPNQVAARHHAGPAGRHPTRAVRRRRGRPGACRQPVTARSAAA